MQKHSFFLKKQRNGFISIIFIIVFSFLSLSYLQNVSEEEIRNTLFDNQKNTQIESTKKIAENIGSDLELVMSMLDGLANSVDLQQGDFYSIDSENLLKEKYNQYKNIINRLFLLNKDDVVSISLADKGLRSSLGKDLSFRDWVAETKSTLRPSLYGGFERQDIYRIFITYPIISRENNDYLGMLVASIPTVGFFSHYANVEHVNSSFVVSFDKEGTILANGANDSLVGKKFFGEYVQSFINHNYVLNNLTRSLLNGQSGYAIYDYGHGERLTTQHPITVQNREVFFIQLVTPTQLFYSDINKVLSSDRIKLFLLFSTIFALVIALVFFLIKLNKTLNEEVKKRTAALKASNEHLRSTNKLLLIHERMQKEFINIAAHQLRTPIQPILSLPSLVNCSLRKGNIKEAEELVDVIDRNAKRLHKLTEEILDVTRMESQLLHLKKEKINLNELLLSITKDFKNELRKRNNKLAILLEANEIIGADNVVFINADRERITQSISNIIDNAINFTEEGIILIKMTIEKPYVTISIIDAGPGIDHDIFPRLFTKFATKSFNGTGLGLYITKKIIESHDGRIWAENNENRKGATFCISLPLLN